MNNPRQVYELMDNYMINNTSQNLDNIFNHIRQHNLNPSDFLVYAVARTNKRVVEALFDIAQKNGLNLKNMANITFGDYGDTVLSEALLNGDLQESKKIIRILLENGANPNLETDGRMNFFKVIYEDEMNSADLPYRMTFLQNVRNMLTNKFQHNCPRQHLRFRRAGQAPRGIGIKKQTKKNPRATFWRFWPIVPGFARIL